MTYKNKALVLFAAGFEPIPVRGKVPTAINNWSTMIIDEQQVKAWGSNGHANDNIGIRCTDECQAIDVDVYDLDVSKKLAAWLDNELNGGNQLPRRFGQLPKFLVPCNIKGITSKQFSTKYIDNDGRTHQIEILAKGQQYVSHGIHPDTKEPYRWSGASLEETGLMELPEFEDVDVTGLLFDYFDQLAEEKGWQVAKKIKKRTKNKLDDPFANYHTPPEFDELTKAVELIPDKCWHNYEDWTMAGMVIDHSTDKSEEGFELYDANSKKSDKYPGREKLRKKWNSFNPNREDIISFGTLFDFLCDFFDQGDVVARIFGTDVTTGNNNDVTSVTNVTNVTDVTNVTSLHDCYKDSVTNYCSISDTVRAYINESEEEFSIQQLYQELGITRTPHKTAARVAVLRMEKDGIVEKSIGRRGAYRPIVSDIKKMNLDRREIIPVNLPLPLNLSNYVRILPKSIIIVGGATNAGKTSFCLTTMLNLLQESCNNRERDSNIPPVHVRSLGGGCLSKMRYLNVEASEEEMINRFEFLSPEDYNTLVNNVEFIDRPRNWSKAIIPDGINFLDYLAIYDKFYEIGKIIDDIHQQLTTGIAMILVQKKANEELPRGAAFAIERSRLAITLDTNEDHGFICKVNKLKIPVDFKKRINGYECDYTIGEDIKFNMQSGWRLVDAKRRRKINAQYKDDAAGNDFREKF